MTATGGTKARRQVRSRGGEYRVRYRSNEAEGQVVGLDIDHRRDAYQS